MALPTFTRTMIEHKLGIYCEKRVPPELMDQVRLGFRIKGNSVTLFEEQPAFLKPNEWVEIKIAQFRFNLKTNEWTLYCADRNSRWHGYWDLEPSKNFDDLLQEVDEDPAGIFWG